MTPATPTPTGKMSRYEGRFERSFYKALKELQRVQSLRAAVSDSGNGTASWLLSGRDSWLHCGGLPRAVVRRSYYLPTLMILAIGGNKVARFVSLLECAEDILKWP
jgi:hypothetical protein